MLAQATQRQLTTPGLIRRLTTQDTIFEESSNDNEDMNASSDTPLVEQITFKEAEKLQQ